MKYGHRWFAPEAFGDVDYLVSRLVFPPARYMRAHHRLEQSPVIGIAKVKQLVDDYVILKLLVLI
jgi:hypothetical protein